jgi:LPS-assembly protein
MRLRRYRLAMSAVLMLGAGIPILGAGSFALSTPAHAATDRFRYNQRPPVPKPPKDKSANNGQMLVKALEINYDYNNNRVAAVGNVQIYYNGSTLEADKVIYDQKTKRLHAEGNVRLTEPDGRVVNANLLDLSDDYRDGFVDSLHLNTPDETRMSAARADRTNGDITIFQSGTYTACAECRDHPERPPLWQVKAARIIHNKTEQMLYFEDAKVEFFGHPLAYLPYFSTPDPTVKRKTGFLMPWASYNSFTGYSAEIPFYWAIAPNYDMTIAPRVSTRQGVLGQIDFRHRLVNGAYEIRAYGINQQDPSAFAGQVGDRKLRSGFDSNGQFALNDKWVAGWTAVMATDNRFFSDYKLGPYRNPLGSFLLTPTEGISQAYLTGVGNRSYFDIRSIYYFGFNAADVQRQIPVVAPVIDYNNVLGHNLLGGEFSYKGNFVNLTRGQANFDAISPTAQTLGNTTCLTADPAAKTRANCLLRGVPGDYTRLSGEAQWRRSFTDPIGQIFTSFVSLRGDLIHANVSNDFSNSVGNYIAPGDHQEARLMPAVGLEYRYPFINVQPWGTTTIEPIAQVILRPNEQKAGQLPNEDAQSLTFDDTNLFSVNKFSGWDRVEGGGRANVGVQATTQFDRGGSINMLFGQSYQLYGLNSYAVQSLTNTGLDSGLDKPASDYVGRVAYSPNKIFSLTTRFRLDEATMDVKRFEAEGKANFDRWSVSLLYGKYSAQPELGFLTERQGLLGTGSFKLAANWQVSGGLRYDIANDKVNQYIVGAGYVDDCFLLAVNYVTDYNYTTIGSIAPVTDHRVMFQLGLRTIGGTSLSQNVSSSTQ